ncbi:MAG: glycine zipper domain-containing protein [Pseudomonadota bacterium]
MTNATKSDLRNGPRSGLGRILAAGVASLSLVAVGCDNAGQGALSGASLGALGGLAIGSLTGSAGAGAAIGAISGGLGGAIIGDQNERNSRPKYNEYDY